MPTFGDFETFGEPLAITEDRGHVATVWRARKAEDLGDPTFAIKLYSPQRRTVPDGQPDDALEHDPAQKFLAGIKQLQKAHNEGARSLAPIHDFGFADEGVWYASDFYPRNTLKAWIARRGGVDSAALRQVVHTIVTGCLALKRARGFSHGNLKAANVFLVGKPRPLRRTPLHLADAYPAAPLQLSRLVRNGRRDVADPPPAALEVQDLRALGELLLQLVEGRLVTSAYDYNYPIEPSPAWDHLGRDGRRWRELCNRLLDPQLSLEKTSLEGLAKEFRPGVATEKLPLILGVAAGFIVLGGGIYAVTSMISSSGKKQFQTHFQAATNAFAADNWLLAQREIASALQREPADRAAGEWKSKIDARLDQEYTAAIQAGRSAFPTNLDEASKWAKRAGDLKPSGQDASALQAQISTERDRRDLAQTQQQKQLELEAKFNSAIEAGQAAYTRRDFQTAFDKAVEALSYKAGDAVATKLRSDADSQLKSVADREARYDAALKSAQAAFARNDFKTAWEKAGEALSQKPGDVTATKLKNDADANMKSMAEREGKYDAALKEGQAAFGRNDFKTAMEKAGEALSYKQGDATATKLRNDADANLKSIAEREAKYEAALKEGQAAFGRNDFKTAMDKAGEALSYKQGDAAATKLRNDADANLRSLAERQAKYDAAFKAGQAAFDRNDFQTAMDKAGEALSYKAGDTAATKLKNDAEGRLTAAKLAQENARKFEAAMAAGRAAAEKKDFETAIKQADEALKIRAGDSAATKLKSDAEGQIAAAKLAQENAQKYEAAMAAARAAAEKKDYETAVKQADEALKIRLGDSAATKLKNEAEGQIAAAKLAQENTRKYEVAMTAGRAAAERKDYETAVKQAQEALKIRLGDSAATKLKTDAEGQILAANRERDFQTATGDFAKGNYEAALQACAKYTATDKNFETLARNIQAEQKLIEAAKRDPNTDDYSAFGTLNDPTIAKKPPVQALLLQAEKEKADLTELRGMRSQTNWPAVQGKLKNISSAYLLRKAPFEDLRKWADGEFDKQEQKRKELAARLNNELECFKVWFGLGSDDKKVLVPEGFPNAGKRPQRLGTIGFDGKAFYEKRVAWLQGQYEKPLAPALEKTFKDLKSRIDGWE